MWFLATYLGGENTLVLQGRSKPEWMGCRTSSSYSDTKPMPFKTDIPLVPTVTCPGWRLRAEQGDGPDLLRVCPERRLVLLLSRVLASEHKTTLRKLLGAGEGT